MKLIVGLGNPGKQYELTRHNIGFQILTLVGKEIGIELNQFKFKGYFCKTNYEGQEVIFLAPQTYMNLSGDSVISFVNYFKIAPENILIIHDDVDLGFGQIQFKASGTAAGHNGLKSIFNVLKTEKIMRLRVGIGRSNLIKTADWVLSNFDYQELLAIEKGKRLLIDSVLA